MAGEKTKPTIRIAKCESCGKRNQVTENSTFHETFSEEQNKIVKFIKCECGEIFKFESFDELPEKNGRPSKYTDDLADEICERLAAGESLIGICRDDHMPTEACVRLWALNDREGFYSRYSRSRELQYERWAEEINEIGDDSRNDWIERESEKGRVFTSVDHEHVQRSKLRCDNRKWLLSKLMPKKYGDRVTHAGDKESPVEVNSNSDRDLARAILGVLSKSKVDDKDD